MALAKTASVDWNRLLNVMRHGIPSAPGLTDNDSVWRPRPMQPEEAVDVMEGKTETVD